MAGPYSLRHGLTIAKVAITPPKPLFSGTVRFLPNGSSRMPKVRFSTAPTSDENGRNSTAAYQVSANVTTQGFTKKQMEENDVRFVQVCNISKWRAVYAGRKDADGMLSFETKLTQHFMDCLTDATGTHALNFPYYDGRSTDQSSSSYFPMLDDSPGATLEGDVYNSRTSRNNYLWTFENETSFISVVVFVHADGTREILEGWEWSLKRSLEINWADGQPVVANAASVLQPERDSTDTKWDPRRSLILQPEGVGVVNIEFSKALANYRDDPGFYYFERYNYDPDETPPDEFWN